MSSIKQIINAKIVTENGVIDNGTVIFDNKITSVLTGNQRLKNIETIDANGSYLLPGFVDLHVHGYASFDASDVNIDQNPVTEMAKELIKCGTVAFLATTVTLPLDVLSKAFENARTAQTEDNSCSQAKILGIHAEGPFISHARKGCMDERYICETDSDFILKNKDIIKMITVAPESVNAADFIRKVKAESEIIISIGHSDVDFDTARSAISLGATHVTHLFNAMSPLNHRNPGMVGAALLSDSVSCELICDTFHIHPSLFKLVALAKGDKFVAITDCIRAGSLPDGIYDLGGTRVTLDGIKCVTDNGVIAGSVLTLNKAIFNMVSHGVPLHIAVNAVSLNPCKVLGIDKTNGSISIGKIADLVLCDLNFTVSSVYRCGTLAYCQ